MTTFDYIIMLITYLTIFMPLVLSLLRFINRHANNKTIDAIIKRTEVIVSALENSGLSGKDKKTQAMKSLSDYAKEVGITISPEQMSDYIESAVRALKQVNVNG